jgi:hypothetical protein
MSRSQSTGHVRTDNYCVAWTEARGIYNYTCYAHQHSAHVHQFDMPACTPTVSNSLSYTAKDHMDMCGWPRPHCTYITYSCASRCGRKYIRCGKKKLQDCRYSFPLHWDALHTWYVCVVAVAPGRSSYSSWIRRSKMRCGWRQLHAVTTTY